MKTGCLASTNVCRAAKIADAFIVLPFRASFL
jgi:hypothetical protein